MSEAKSLLEAIKKVTPADVVQHPFSFALGVGLANGAIAVARGKRINLPTAIALTAILGLGEAAINHFESGPKKHSDWEVAWMSVLGVAVGVAPFVSLEEHAGSDISLPIAEKREEVPEGTKEVAT